MKKYVIYNKSTGKILSAIQTSRNPENDIPEGYDYLETYESTTDKKIDVATKDIIDSTDEKPYIISQQAKIKKHRSKIYLWISFLRQLDDLLFFQHIYHSFYPLYHLQYIQQISSK